MATTTPNFGWPVPTSTDLVKDGATAIEALGDGVDASFIDLKGGTTGQVLAKASNTDLDYSWVTTDDTNAIQNAIVDAKGDLIGATAADTPARLAVGANNTILTADSAEATGLKWTGTWISYTPTWGIVSGTAPALGNGSIAGGYRRIGDQIDFWATLTYGSTTTFGSGTAAYTLTLPVALSTSEMNFSYSAVLLDSGVAWYEGYSGSGVTYGFADKFVLWNPSFTTNWSPVSPVVPAANDAIRVFGSYRVSA